MPTLTTRPPPVAANTTIAPEHHFTARGYLTSASDRPDRAVLRSWLLMCGIASAALYPLSDIIVGLRYPGYSFADQAVSELFAIGAPTSALLVPLFSLSSALLLAFAIGVWLSRPSRRLTRVMAIVIAANAIDALVLWNFFPMHMRGETPSFTDTMHGLLAINPFVIAMLVLGAIIHRRWFRRYTIATIAFTLVLSIMGFSYIPAIIAGEPTPLMGLTERAAHYATNVWVAVLAIVLLREQRVASVSQVPNHLRIALGSGILSAILYAGMLVFVPMEWPGYSSASQTVSELSAIGAPSRSQWISLGMVWGLLYAAFGWGVWRAAGALRALRIAGGSIFVAAALGLFWPPMHTREVLAQGGATLTDTLHIAWTAANGLLTLLAIAFAAVAFGWQFRLYSIATIVILIGAGVMTSLDVPRMQENLTTPWMGAWERVNIAAWLIWVVALAVMSWRQLPSRVIH